VGIEMGQNVFLDDDSFVARHREGKLQYFHRCEFTAFADIISGILISNKNRLKYGWPCNVPLPDG
jgi:hypothetical protein